MSVSDRTIHLLKQAGWYEGRSIDVSNIIKFLSDRGYEPFQSAKGFLEEFGNLTITVPLKETYARDANIHRTDPIEAVGDYYTYGSFEEEEEEYGERLIPVGDLYDSNLVLLISESGKFYCETCKIGNNAWEMWEDLCTEE